MITVIDSMMGTGKTTWAINYMKANPFQKYLYISPFKDEGKRIKKACPGLRFYVPPDSNDDQYNKIKNRKTNRRSKKNKIPPKFPLVKSQLKNGKNIVSTHVLFKSFDEECITLIRDHGYVLILDEVLEVMNSLELKKPDIKMIIDSGATIVDKEHQMIWTDKYSNLSEKGLGWLENTIKLDKVINVDNKALFWQFPPDMFTAFKDVYILTYLFEANVMKSYFNINNINYIKKSIKDNKLHDFYPVDLSVYKDLIYIYDGKLNTNIYQTKKSFSLSWYQKKKNRHYLNKMRNNLFNWFSHISGSTAQDRLWTCFKDYQFDLEDKGYMTCFLFHSCRATNTYKNKSCLAYCINRFYNPMLKKYFSYMGYPLNEDLYALSEMIQWIWRSQIRDQKPISIYIPSNRMRNLLIDWLNGKYS